MRAALRLKALLFFAAIIFVMMNGRAQAVPATVVLQGTTLDVSGEMDSMMLSQLRGQSWTQVRTVRFTSAGGLPEYSVDIAELLANTGKPIVIHDICSSACVDVLAIKDGTIIEPDTVILLHNTPRGQAIAMHAYPAIARYLAALGEREQSWLERNGVDPLVSLISEIATIPVCVYAPADDPKMAAKIITVNRFEVWAPRSSTLASLGFQAARHWQQDGFSVLRVMRARYPRANLDRMRLADEPAMPSADAMSRFLREVPICKPSGVLN